MTTEQTTEDELKTKARKTLEVEKSPGFDSFKTYAQDTADDYRQMATDEPAESSAKRLQLVDMAKGIDHLMSRWDESVRKAKEILNED